jgi:hypothetical protein
MASVSIREDQPDSQHRLTAPTTIAPNILTKVAPSSEGSRVKRAADKLAKDKRNHPNAEQANSRAGDS